MRLLFLGLLATVFAGCTSSTTNPAASEPGETSHAEVNSGIVRVGLFNGSGAGAEYVTAVRNVIASEPKRFSLETFSSGSVDFHRYNVVIFPGGIASTQWSALGASGQARLRSFVSEGGGYIGICAGFYMALPGNAGFLNADIVLPWDRGEGNVRVKLASGEAHAIRYVNGPVLWPTPNVNVLATFDGNIGALSIPTMVGKAAIVSADFGRGHVVGISPHPELSGVGHILKDAVSRAASKAPPPPSDCQGLDEIGTCTGTVLEWCENGTRRRVDCATKLDGRTACGPDRNPALGNNCIHP